MMNLANDEKPKQACLKALSLVPYFSIFFIDGLFLFIETFCIYVDDSTMYSSDKNTNIVISILRHDFAIILKKFYENRMVLSPDKYYYLTLGFNEPFPDFSFNDIATENVTKEKILGIVIDNKLNLNAKRLTKNSVHSQEHQN